MKVAIVSGSHRADSQSLKIANYLSAQLVAKSVQAEVISLSKNPLPLWSEEMFQNGEYVKNWQPISDKLVSADAIILISPEWAGMVPAGLKNFLLHCSNKECAHKPGLIVSVSAGISGAYPISELRSSGCKNNRLCFIPDHVIVRNVTDVLNSADSASDRDTSIREQLSYSLSILLEYAKALKLVRESGVVNTEKFPYGM